MSTTISGFVPQETGWTAFLQTSHMAENASFPKKIKNWSQIVSLNKTEFLERRRLNNNESSTFIRIFYNMQTS